MKAKFGPAGNGEGFKKAGFKKTIDSIKYVKSLDLDVFEYQCGKGVRTNEETGRQFGEEAKQNGIELSIHAPYYISLSSVEEEKRNNSINYILQSARLADFMGAKRIIIHSGSCSKMTREEALELAKDTLLRARQAAIDENLGHITFCPETMGKINQLGNLEEVISLCKYDDSFIPCIDFGHLNARHMGFIKGLQEYSQILNSIEDKLGADRLKVFHSHFSKIEYTEKGGEIKHLTFKDCEYGPDYEPLMEIIARKNLAPTIICESSGTQDVDALTMKKFYLSVLE